MDMSYGRYAQDGHDPEAIRNVAVEGLSRLTHDYSQLPQLVWESDRDRDRRQDSAIARMQIAQIALQAPAASLGTCGAHQADLLFEGRSDGLYVSCGQGCDWKLV